MTDKEAVCLTLASIALYFLIGALWAVRFWRADFQRWLQNREYRVQELREGKYTDVLYAFRNDDTTTAALAIFAFWPFVWPYRSYRFACEWAVNQLARSALPPMPPQPPVLGEAPSYRDLPEEKEART